MSEKTKKPFFKKWWFWLIIVVVVIAIAVGGDDEGDAPEKAEKADADVEETNDESNDDATQEDQEEEGSEESKEESKEESEESSNLGIGDTAEFDDVKFTLKDVTTTDERNEFADEDPNAVILIEYELENIGDEDYPYGADITVYDADGNQMESYPLDVDMGSLAPGKKVQGVDAHGVEATGTIEIHFAPLISFDSAAIFEVDIE